MRLMFVLLMLLPTAALSDGLRAYASASFGQAKLKAGTAEGSTSVVNLGAGYRLSASFAVEVLYVDTGDALSVDRSDIGPVSEQVTTATVETKGLGAFVRWTIPAGDTIQLVARAGAYRLTSEVAVRVVEQDKLPPFNPRVLSDTKIREREWLPAIALGADIVLGKHGLLGIGVEAARGGNTLERMNSVTATIQVRF